jgi:hypothetical protein
MAERNMSSYTMRPKRAKIVSAQTSTANLKIGSPISYREIESNGGAVASVVGTGLSVFFSTGCGPGLLGEFRAGSAIQGLTVAEACYKDVKINPGRGQSRDLFWRLPFHGRACIFQLPFSA